MDKEVKMELCGGQDRGNWGVVEIQPQHNYEQFTAFISIDWLLPVWLLFHLINTYFVLVAKYFE